MTDKLLRTNNGDNPTKAKVKAGIHRASGNDRCKILINIAKVNAAPAIDRNCIQHRGSPQGQSAPKKAYKRGH